MKKILIVAGEPSGDLQAAQLVSELRSQRSDLEFFGLGGEKMREANVRLAANLANLAVVGFFEVLKNYHRFRAIFYQILKQCRQEKPDLAILVDYPGFNLRLAKKLKKMQIPIIYYISPQVWAWGKKRVALIKQLVTKMICLFQFEEELYKKAGIDASWVGHPLVDLAKPRFEKNEFLKIIGREKTKLTVCLMPGSRKKEVKNHLGLLLKTAQLMQRQYGNLQFVLVKSPNLDHPLYERYLRKLNLPLSLVNGQTYDCLNVCDLALVASGTATLECLLLEKPLLILYKVGFLSYLLGKFLVKIPYLGMVNVLAEKEICPEFIQARAKAKNLTQAAIRLLGNERLRKEMILEEFLVKAKLGKPGAVKRAAEIILHYL